MQRCEYIFIISFSIRFFSPKRRISVFTVLCRSRRELSNEHLLATVGFDTAENEPSKAWPAEGAVDAPLTEDGAQVDDALPKDEAQKDESDDSDESEVDESQAAAAPTTGEPVETYIFLL